MIEPSKNPSPFPDRSAVTGSVGPTPLVPLSGSWWVRPGSLAMARGEFRFPQPSPRLPGWRGWFGRFSWLERFYQLRRGEGMVSTGDLTALVLTVEPQMPLQVRMSRLFAFEDGLEFRHRFLRRIPMSPAGAWHTAVLTGQGRAVVGCSGYPFQMTMSEDESAETDFDPEVVVAWQPAQAPLSFRLHRLTLTSFLLPSGVRDVRMILGAPCDVWLDGGAPQIWPSGQRLRRPNLPAGWPPPR